jgi:hypothetical protein
MKNLTGTAILITGCKRPLLLLTMLKGDKENIEIEIKGCVLDIHFGGEKKASQKSVNHLQRLVCVIMTGEHCSSGVHTDVAISCCLY